MQTFEPVSIAPQPDAHVIDFAAQFGLNLAEYKKLVQALTYEEVVTCLELLKASKHRSGFRSRMSAQIRTWLRGSPHLKPMTPNQFQAMTPRWPVTYMLP